MLPHRRTSPFPPIPPPSAPVPPPAPLVDKANPKDAIGSTKVSKFPAIAVAHGAHAMMDGAGKYGPYNWRDKAVRASIYIDAAKRHLDCWFERQEKASDSGVHHLGHAIACCAILLDAQAAETLVDDRPGSGYDLAAILGEMSAATKAKRQPVGG